MELELWKFHHRMRHDSRQRKKSGFPKRISKSLTSSEKPTQVSHIARPGQLGQLAAPRAGIPLAHRCRRALRGTLHTHAVERA
eukprot:7449992-Pyramimonas_sp.AAC.1